MTYENSNLLYRLEQIRRREAKNLADLEMIRQAVGSTDEIEEISRKSSGILEALDRIANQPGQADKPENIINGGSEK